MSTVNVGSRITPARINDPNTGINSAMGSLTTSSTTYVDVPSPSSTSITKLNSAGLTNLKVDLRVGFRAATSAPTGARFAVRINGVDYDVCQLEVSATALLSCHLPISGVRLITGIAAGAWTVQARMRRYVGSGSLVVDSTDWISLHVSEVPV